MLYHISGVKNWQTLAALLAAQYRATRKTLESKTHLDEPAECTSGVDPLLLYKILHLLFFPLVQVPCALSLENKKKLSTCS
jgi:hypothetical protein